MVAIAHSKTHVQRTPQQKNQPARGAQRSLCHGKLVWSPVQHANGLPKASESTMPPHLVQLHLWDGQNYLFRHPDHRGWLADHGLIRAEKIQFKRTRRRLARVASADGCCCQTHCFESCSWGPEAVL